MKIIGNCQQYGGVDCPFLLRPTFHSGYTGKSGPDTWWSCDHLKKYLRDIKKCPLAGKPGEAQYLMREQKAEEAKKI